MILLYSTLVFLLGAAQFLIGRRARTLERKYMRVAQETDALVKQSAFKDGNSSKADPCMTAKRQYLLGQFVQKRDRVEARYTAWQVWAEKFGRWVANVKSWQGKKLPYTFGAVDVTFILGLIDYLGFRDYVGIQPLLHFVTGLFTR
jgi:hypothetical protein